MAGDKVYYQVITYIEEMVKQKKITFGGKLPSEREMMEQLSLSRNSIREALRTLEHLGLIESRHGKGTYLVNHMGASLRSVFSMLIFLKESTYLEVSQLRRAIEAEAFDLLILKITEEEKREFEKILEQIPFGDAEHMVKVDRALHNTLISYSENRLLFMMMDALSEVCDTCTRLIIKGAVEKNAQWWQEIHSRICRSIIDGDRQAGLAAIEEHYDWIDKEIYSLL